MLGCQWQESEDNIEYTFAVNYLGHFLLIQELTDLLISSSPSRIIILSSESHRYILRVLVAYEYLNYLKTIYFRFTDLDYSSRLDLTQVPLSKEKYWSILAYNQSKLCCLMLSMELNCRLNKHGVTSFAVNPGNLVYSSLYRHSWLYWLLFYFTKPFTKTPVCIK